MGIVGGYVNHRGVGIDTKDLGMWCGWFIDRYQTMSSPPSPKRYREDHEDHEDYDEVDAAIRPSAMVWKRFVERPRALALPHRALIKALEVIDYDRLYKVIESPQLVEDAEELQIVKDIQNGHSGEWL